jgi:oligopeptide/dipeptide ABC transporter ATP-binding protein
VSLLDVRGLTISYADAPEPAVDRLDLSLQSGESLGLVGESGSGKTQTALAIMGLLPPHARVDGQVFFDDFALSGKPPKILNRFRARRLAMVFQDPKQALNPYLRIGEQLKRVLLEHRMVDRRAARGRALELLRRVRLPDAERQYAAYPHQLSGGMRQRAMIALALSCEPELLIADEPTTALDVTVQAQVLRLLKELRTQTGIALLLITHDLGVIAENCERMLVMHRGRLLEQGSTKAVFRNPGQRITKDMIAAAARLDGTARQRPSASAAPVLQVERLDVSFRDTPTGWTRQSTRGVVRNVSFALGAGETLAVVGESGCGKTSLAKAIVGLVAAEAGSVQLSARPLAARVQDRPLKERRELQMVFQDPVASLSPAMRVGGIIDEPIALHEPRLRPEERKDRVASALRRAGLDDSLLQRFPHELSGGQAQRVAISRALVLQPKVLICDEAVAALDGTVRRAVLELLAAEQQRSGLSLVFITHDLAVVRQISHRVLVMYMGGIAELAGNEQLFARPRHPYTRALMSAVPVADPERVAPPVPVEGELMAEGRPAGCPFHPRCAHAVARCRKEVPVLRRVDGVDVACHRAEELDLRQSI